jgi:hypothetical protein
MDEWYEIRQNGIFCNEHNIVLTPAYLPKGALRGTFTGPLLECLKCGKQVDKNKIPR